MSTIDNLISSYLKPLSSFTFIQIGANDGVSNDKINPFVKKDNCYGVVVEPLPDVFSVLQKTYEGFTNIITVNRAVNETRGTSKFYTLTQTGDLRHNPMESQWSSFDYNTFIKHKRYTINFEERIKILDIECVPFLDLFVTLNKSMVDILLIDTEGFDYEILKSIDFVKIDINAIVYEHQHLSPSQKADCVCLLEKHGYKLTSDSSDTFAIKKTLKM